MKRSFEEVDSQTVVSTLNLLIEKCRSLEAERNFYQTAEAHMVDKVAEAQMDISVREGVIEQIQCEIFDLKNELGMANQMVSELSDQFASSEERVKEMELVNHRLRVRLYDAENKNRFFDDEEDKGFESDATTTSTTCVVNWNDIWIIFFSWLFYQSNIFSLISIYTFARFYFWTDLANGMRLHLWV